jgi:hypothetical protein
MSIGNALRSALGDTYRYSWRLLVVNSAVSGVVCAVVLVVSAFPLVLLVAPVFAGPVAAALVYCVVMLVRDGSFELTDALYGLRRFWRQGLALGAMFGAALLLGALAVTFYSSVEHRAVPLAVLSVYVVAIVCLILLVAWPLAISEPERGLGDALRRAWSLALHAPLRLFMLGSVLLIVNVAGALTVLPLLTLTIAYSFLATARVVLPVPNLEEATT